MATVVERRLNASRRRARVSPGRVGPGRQRRGHQQERHDARDREREPRVDRAEQPAAERRDDHPGGLDGGERPHAAAEALLGRRLGERGQEQRARERVRRALQRPQDKERHDARGQRDPERGHGVGEERPADRAPAAEALADRARDELQRRERQQVGGQPGRDRLRRRVEGPLELGDEDDDHATAERPEEPAEVQGRAGEALAAGGRVAHAVGPGRGVRGAMGAGQGRRRPPGRTGSATVQAARPALEAGDVLVGHPGRRVGRDEQRRRAAAAAQAWHDASKASSIHAAGRSPA